jgi:hypothetical protein
VSTAVAAIPPRTAVAPGPRFRAVLTLGLVEGRRLITHPVFLVGPCLLLITVLRGPGAFRFLFLSGLGFFVIGIGTLVASSLCASRSRRDKTEELYRSLPLRSTDRTVAQLLSVAFPFAAALTIAALVAIGTRPWAGASARLDIEPRTIMHGLPDFALGPLLIAFLGVAGVMLARWFSTPVAVPVAIGGIVAFNSLTDLSSGPVRWLNAGASYSSRAPEPAAVMSWHLVYVVGLILVLGLVAVIGRSRTRALYAFGAAAVALSAVGGVMQVLAASP